MALQIKSIKNKNSECEAAMERRWSKLLTSAALVISFGVTNPNFDQEINLIGDSLENEQETLNAEMFKGTFLHNIIGKGRHGENTRNGAVNTEEQINYELKKLYELANSITEQSNKVVEEIYDYKASEQQVLNDSEGIVQEIKRKTQKKKMIMKEIDDLSNELASGHCDEEVTKEKLTRRKREASNIDTEIKDQRNIVSELLLKVATLASNQTWLSHRSISQSVVNIEIAKKIEVLQGKLKAYQAQNESWIKKALRSCKNNLVSYKNCAIAMKDYLFNLPLRGMAPILSHRKLSRM